MVLRGKVVRHLQLVILGRVHDCRTMNLSQLQLNLHQPRVFEEPMAALIDAIDCIKAQKLFVEFENVPVSFAWRLEISTP